MPSKNETSEKDVDAYLSSLPEDQRIALENLRQIIRATTPEAEEIISYKIPTFRYHGSLVGFSAAKKHCSFHLMSPAVMKLFKAELKGFKTTTATIHFSKSQPIPEKIVKKIVKARMEENESRRC